MGSLKTFRIVRIKFLSYKVRYSLYKVSFDTIRIISKLRQKFKGKGMVLNGK